MPQAAKTVLSSRIERALAHQAGWDYLGDTVRSFATIELRDYFNAAMADEQSRCVRALTGCNLDALGVVLVSPAVHATNDPLSETVGYLCNMLAAFEQVLSAVELVDAPDLADQERHDALTWRVNDLYRALGAPFLFMARRYQRPRAANMRTNRDAPSGLRARRAELSDYRRYNERAFQLPLGGAQLRGLVDVAILYRASAVVKAALTLAERPYRAARSQGEAPAPGVLMPGVSGAPVPRAHAAEPLVTQSQVDRVLDELGARDASIKDFYVEQLDARRRIQNPAALRRFLRFALVLPVTSAYRAGACSRGERTISPSLAASPVLAHRLRHLQSATLGRGDE